MTATASVGDARAASVRGVISRRALRGATRGRLLFAQVREDPLLEIEALRVRSSGRYVVVGSGGCTALSMIAAGAGHVSAVDLSSAQNNLTELKAVARALVSPWEYPGFLGAETMSPARRSGIYRALRTGLSTQSVRYWDVNQGLVAGGVLDSGATEKFIRALTVALRAFVHPRDRISRLLSCRTLDEQRCLLDDEWNSRRWRALFHVLVNRWTFDRTYDPAFFSSSGTRSFALHFLALFDRTVREVPVSTNYFLHHMLSGTYPVSAAGGIPPYLDPGCDFSLQEMADRLELVDGRYEDYLSTCATQSVDGFALSNICEWMDEGAIENLFGQVRRVARPGAIVCFRNFVGHTEVPAPFRDTIVEDCDAGLRAIARDRSCVQARIAICRVTR